MTDLQQVCFSFWSQQSPVHTTYADQENNKLLRSLCVDALIELSDENADWKLSFQEFLKCLCIEQCKPHKRPVCGSNGKTYLNHCELHRDACLTGSKIQVDYDGHCKEKKSASPSASPVVCYQANRDELRRRLIQWLEAEIIPDGWFSKGSNYSEILDKYFKSFDNGDSHLDSSEFLKFVEQNETAINITTYADQEYQFVQVAAVSVGQSSLEPCNTEYQRASPHSSSATSV